MAVGVIRKVDNLGRVTVPKELRDYLEINIQDPAFALPVDLYNIR